MTHPAVLLSRAPHRDKPLLPVMGEMSLARMRVHEFCGRARRRLALWVAGAVQRGEAGPVIWVAPKWESDGLFAPGMAGLCRPEGFIFVHAARAEDMLWTLEEVLRSGAVPLVVGDLQGWPNLTQVRRMHLAAEAGAAELGGAPLGLLLTPGAEGGAPGVESRWVLEPTHRPGAERWRLIRTRARTAPVKVWDVAMGPTGAVMSPLPGAVA